MLQRLLQNILANEKLMNALRVLGWTFIVITIIYTNIIMKEQEISFVYNNF